MCLTDPPGVDLARLTAWFDQHLPGGRQGPLAAEVLTGGRSNLTYRLTDGSRAWALRRPPLGHVLPTAHDMARECRVISGLAGTAVPVPRPVALCTDGAVLGCDFYLMDFVDGTVLDRPGQVPGPGAARHVSELLVDTLLTLHGTDPAAAGLAGLGRAGGFRERQVERWHRQFAASWEGEDRAELEVLRRLRRDVPGHGPAGIVHGDYRLTNLMFSPGLDAVAAVVDWEMATLGDPLTDLGLLYAYHHLAARAPVVMPDFGPADGFLGARDLLDRYLAAGPEPGAALEWYLALAFFKTAAIGAGIHARFRQGLTVGAGFEVFESLVHLSLGEALEYLPG